MKKIVFAFALNSENIFVKKSFVEAEKFVVYEFDNGALKHKEELINPVVNMPEETSSAERKEKLVSLLKSREISVLVAQQFSKNLRLVTDEFIPVLIEKEKPEQVIEILNKNMAWILDELKNRKSGHMLFRINTGVLKLAIK